MVGRKKMYRAGQKLPGGKVFPKSVRQGKVSKTNAGKTHSVKSRSRNHGRTRW
jgi:hypothetical protein